MEDAGRTDTVLIFSEALSLQCREILGELAMRQALEKCQGGFADVSFFFPKNAVADVASQRGLQGSKGVLASEEKARLLERLRPRAVSEYVSPWLPPHRAIRTDYLNGRLIYAPW
jgi:hypothetical protein